MALASVLLDSAPDDVDELEDVADGLPIAESDEYDFLNISSFSSWNCISDMYRPPRRAHGTTRTRLRSRYVYESQLYITKIQTSQSPELSLVDI
jgi:hypothetical protein